MFADTLLQLERGHLLRLLLWAAASVVAGTALITTLMVARTRSRLLSGFSATVGACGVAELAAGAWGWQGLGLLDLAGATRLDRLLWLAMGLDVGLVASGVVLAIAAWRFGHRSGALGAGLAIAMHGAALLSLHARFALALQGLV